MANVPGSEGSASLEQADTTFRQIVEMAPDAMVVVDSAGVIRQVNDQLEKLFGYSRNELVGAKIECLVPPRFRSHHEAHRNHFFSSARARPMGAGQDLFGLHRDGTEFPVEISLSPLGAESGYMVSAAIRDMRERRRIEGELRRVEQMFRLMVESVVDYAMIMLDPQGRVTSWNEGAVRILGYDAREIIGRSFACLFLPEDRARGRPQGELAQAAAEGRSQDEGWRLRSDGEPFWASVIMNSLRDENGALQGFVKITQDLTERRRAENEIRSLNESLERRVYERTVELETAYKELEGFSYSVSHDLRMPLRAIDGFSRKLLEDYAEKLDGEGRRRLNIVRSSAQRMGQLIDDILEFSRMGRAHISRAPIDMGAFVHSIFDELQDGSSDVVLAVGALPQVHGDRAMMRQVWVNLLSNSMKYRRRDPPSVIEVGAMQDGDEDVFFVRDNGVGFDMRYVDKLFGVFQRLHSVDEFEGTGIGLAIVKRIVNRHGGRVWAEGRLNEGAVFYFSLPRARRNGGE